jgi:hypothetical protein
MMIIDETTLTGDVRAGAAAAPDNGEYVPEDMALYLALADFLKLPDDSLFMPGLQAAMQTRVDLADAESVARVRKIARAAGWLRPA